jgi:hypothetical protein
LARFAEKLAPAGFLQACKSGVSIPESLFQKKVASPALLRGDSSANFLPSKDRFEFHGFTPVTTLQ